MAAVRIRIAPLLYSYTKGLKTIEVEASTVRQALAVLDQRYPGITFRVIDEQGQIRPHMNIFVGEQSVRDPDAAVPAGAEIYIVGALSGG